MNKKWLIAIYTMLSVFVVGVVTTVIVLASGTHYVGSNISVIYTASGIGGKLTATYQVGSNTAVNMVGSNNETVIEFGSEEPETVALLSPGDTIVPGYKEDIILTYTFVNEGPTFYATVTYSDTSSKNPKDNIAITYKGEDDTNYTTKSSVVTVAEDATVTYSIKLAVDLPYKDASMDGMIKWALTEEEPIIEETVDNLTLSIANNGDSSVNDANVKAVLSEDGTQFKIVGAVPESAGPTTSSGYVNGSFNERNSVVNADKGTMSVAELTNSSTGAEFFYFCTNPEVVGNTTYGYIDPGTIYWTSTSDTTLESWYDVPTEELNLYSCFMKPNYTGGSYSGSDAQIVISNSVTELPYTAFRKESSITDVAIPQSVKTTEDGYKGEMSMYASGAFDGCTGLESIILPNSLKNIGNGTFSYTGLTSITIPSGVTTIPDDAFYWCWKLTSITIPDSVTSIDSHAFYGCGLPSLTIPDNVKSIGDYAFWGCDGLTSITVASGNTTYYSSGNCIIETSSKTLILGCKNSTIPSGVKSIGSFAFDHCYGLKSITIPSGVTSIGYSAFGYCSGLTSLTIPNSVTSIGGCAFECCSGLTSITIPSSVTSIGNSAFYYCSGLTSITIPDSVTSIGNYAFEDCSGLTSITIPSGVTSIGSRAFSDCSELTSITFAETSYTWKIGSAVSAYSPTDPSTNATYLVTTYKNYTWTKNS